MISTGKMGCSASGRIAFSIRSNNGMGNIQNWTKLFLLKGPRKDSSKQTSTMMSASFFPQKPLNKQSTSWFSTERHGDHGVPPVMVKSGDLDFLSNSIPAMIDDND